MDNIKRNVLSVISVIEQGIESFRKRVSPPPQRRRNIMDNILKRDITGECFGECRNTVREAEIKRQREINRIVREAETASSADPFKVSRAF